MFATRFPIRCQLLLCAAMLAACGGDGTSPTTVRPAAMIAVGDTLFDVAVATVIQAAPSVRVVDAGGAPVGDVEVTFTTEGGGTATGVVARTNGSGVASVGSWVVGTTLGEYKLIASVGGLAPIVFHARTRAKPVSRLIVLSGDEQTDTARALLEQPIVVRAQDQHGNAVAGVTVSFSADPGSGTLSPTTATTDVEGLTTTRWTLGPAAGTARARAAVDASIVASFSATTQWPVMHAVALASGFTHNCAVLLDGRTFCWGDNAKGQLGDGTTTDRSVAVQTSGPVAFKAVAAGSYHSCGLAADGQAYCWGLNNWGQLGDGTKTDKSTPTAVSTTVRFASIDAGSNTTCGLSVDGAVYCWGFMEGSSIALRPDLPGKVSASITFSSIALSDSQLCAISTGGWTYCFGRAFSTEAGDYMWQPLPLAPSPDFVSLTGGLRFMCGLTAAGSAYCWGWNQYGQHGDGTSDPIPSSTDGTPNPTQPVAGNHVFKALDAGYSWVCGTRVDDKTYCWGQNSWGVFGVNGAQVNPTPLPMPTSLVFTANSKGLYHSCAIATSKAVYCWGGGFDGQLGDGVDATTDEFHARATPDVARHR